MSRFIVPVLAILALSCSAYAGEQPRQPRVLIAYFSYTNNTRTLAEQVRQVVAGDMFQIVTKTPYPANRQETVNVARNERDRNLRPELRETIPADVMQQYDIIFLGYPNWWLTMPMAVRTFMEQYDLSGKYIIPFCTHEGSGLSNTVAELRQMHVNANVLEGLAVSARSVSRSQADVEAWLRRLGVIR